MKTNKLFLLSVLVFLSACNLWAAPFFPGYSLSVEPRAGFLFGQAAALVYLNEDPDSDELVSELLWDVKPLWYFGTAFEFSKQKPARGRGFFTALDLQFGFPMDTGFMEDRDWLGPRGELTHFSRHDNRAGNAFMLDFSAGLDTPGFLGSLFSLRASFGFSYTAFSWTARDGYLRYAKMSAGAYPPLSEGDPQIPVAGPVVSFSQNWIYMPMGIIVSFLPGRVFSGDLFFLAGPVFKYLGRDEHLLKANTGLYAEYRDDISGGYMIQPGGEFIFSPSKRLSFSLGVSWKTLSAKPHGDSRAAAAGYTGNRAWELLGRYAGASIQMLDAGLGLEIRL
jgi:outer membrane protease